MLFKNKNSRVWGKTIFSFFALIFTITSCNKYPFNEWVSNGGDGHNNSAGLSAVLRWNEAVTIAITRTGGVPPMIESRVYAIINLAIHDALNTIQPKYKRYALFSKVEYNASPVVAVAYASHDAIVSLLPAQTAYADSLLNVSLASEPEGDAKNNGKIIGKAASAAILTKRNLDGSEIAQSIYVQGTLPGQYRSTPPFDGAPFNGFVAVPGWGNLKPFGLSSTNQFRVVPPYSLNSSDYTKDFNDVKSLGSKNSLTRTADQTEIGLFWLNTAPLSFNRIARTLIIKKNLGTLQAARLLALMAIAEADANIACFESKFYYNYWRPITAIRLGDADGNDNTIGDAAWNVLSPPTPPIPDYPSNHATDGGAGAEVLKLYFENDNVSFETTSSSLKGVTRHYNSFSQAARENSLSRVYVGYHFRNAALKGEEQGRKVGKYIYDNYLGED